MRHSTLLFCKSCFILFQLLQSGLSVMVSLGDSVTLDCNIDQSSLRNLWLKQDIGLAPQVLCELLHYETSSPCAVDPLKQHLITERNKDRFSLNISDIRPSDLGTYFCAEVTSSETIVFRNTIFLTTKDFRGEMKKVEVFETGQHKDHSTTVCTMYSITHMGNSTVNWVGDQMGELLTGIIYTDRLTSTLSNSSSSQLELPGKKCAYNFHGKTYRHSYSEAHQCAVTGCSGLLFRDVFKGNITAAGSDDFLHFDLMNMILAAIDVLLMVLITVLVWRRRKMSKCLQCAGRLSKKGGEEHRNHNEEVSTATYTALEILPSKNRDGRKRKDQVEGVVYSDLTFQRKR
ncbi:uncharacterized protein [Lepisosteus oculatus]|uniref:uncharacterized protein isoform X2 n=1 Tax=Lepisosteus oculatus TaxID=7918 RepID=UPI0035F506C8